MILDDTFKFEPCVLDKIFSSVIVQICTCSSLTLIAFMNEEHSDLLIDFGGMLVLSAICMIIAVFCFAQIELLSRCLADIVLKWKLLLFIVWHVTSCLGGTDPRSD